MKRRQPWLTADQAIDLLLVEHEPTVNETVTVIEDSTERTPTADDLLDDIDPDDLWCNGCHRAASRCTVMPILALVRDPWTQRLRDRFARPTDDRTP